MQLHDIHQGVHRRKRRKRIGRGVGSGHGKTSTKGHKGHSSRQGYKNNPLIQGGQMPLIRRVPKRGFNNAEYATKYAILNVGDLEGVFAAGTVVDEAALRAVGLVKGRHDDGVKVLGDGELTVALTVKAVKFSGQAAEKIAKAGGQAVVVERPRKPLRVWTPEEAEQRKRQKPRGRNALRRAQATQA